jgi:hypothetical protein
MENLRQFQKELRCELERDSSKKFGGEFFLKEEKGTQGDLIGILRGY